MYIANLTYWWSLFKKIALIAGVLLSFFGFIEILHAFSVLRDIHPALGYVFLLLLMGFLAYFLLKILLPIYKRPKALTPPSVVNYDSPTKEECKKYLSYLAKFLERLSRNPNLSDMEVDSYQAEISLIRSGLDTEESQGDLQLQIVQIEKDFINPLLDELDIYAKAEVSRCVRDIMIGVTLSPYRAVDLIIVLYRNLTMISKIVGIYNNRPLLVEQLIILRDVFRVVATVNYLNFGQKLMDQLFSHLPYVGRVLDDCAQGVGAGIMTSAAGHSTIYRCRSYRSWNQEEAVKTLSSHLKDYLSDVKNIFKRDVLPRSKNKIISSANPEDKKDPQFWQKVTDGFSAALDASETIVSLTIKKPVLVGTQTVVYAGSSTFTIIKKISTKSTAAVSSISSRAVSSLKNSKLLSKLRRKKQE